MLPITQDQSSEETPDTKEEVSTEVESEETPDTSSNEEESDKETNAIPEDYDAQSDPQIEGI